MEFSASFPKAYCWFHYSFTVWDVKINISSTGKLKTIPAKYYITNETKKLQPKYVYFISCWLPWTRKTGLLTWTKEKYYLPNQCFPTSTTKMNMLFSLFLRKTQWLYRLKYFKWSVVFFFWICEGQKMATVVSQYTLRQWMRQKIHNASVSLRIWT